MLQIDKIQTELILRKEGIPSPTRGKLILEHILLNQDRADYGAKVLEKLAKDLGVSKSELSRMVEFSRAYPIVAARQQLSWAHYRSLLAVNQIETRKRLTSQTVEKIKGPAHSGDRHYFKIILRAS